MHQFEDLVPNESVIVRQTNYKQLPGGNEIIELDVVDGVVLPDFPKYIAHVATKVMTNKGPVQVNETLPVPGETVLEAFDNLPDVIEQGSKRATQHVQSIAEKQRKRLVLPGEEHQPNGKFFQKP